MFDAVCTNLKKHPADPQTEVDTDVIAKALHDGNISIRDVFDNHVNNLKAQDNFSPSHQQPFSSHFQTFMSALHCKDPADVSAVIDPKDPNKIDFHIDFWRADTNSIYEAAKGHTVNPALIAGADKALNDSIPAEDRDQAVAQFNERARTDKQPMRIELNPQSGEIELKAADPNITASK